MEYQEITVKLPWSLIGDRLQQMGPNPTIDKSKTHLVLGINLLGRRGCHLTTQPVSGRHPCGETDGRRVGFEARLSVGAEPGVWVGNKAGIERFTAKGVRSEAGMLAAKRIIGRRAVRQVAGTGLSPSAVPCRKAKSISSRISSTALCTTARRHPRLVAYIRFNRSWRRRRERWTKRPLSVV